MDFPEYLKSASDWFAAAGPTLSSARDWSAEAGSWLLAVDLPVPDIALVGAFALAVAATTLSQRGRNQAAQSEVEDLYRAELLTANRRAQQARGELRQAKQAIERERQKRRREAAGSKPHARLKNRPIQMRRPDDRIAATA